MLLCHNTAGRHGTSPDLARGMLYRISLILRLCRFFSVRTHGGQFDESGVSLNYGAGVEYDFIRNLGLRAEYVKYQDVGDNNVSKTDIDVTSISLIYRLR